MFATDILYKSNTSNKTKIALLLLFIFMFICMCGTSKKEENIKEKKNKRGFLEEWMENNPNKTNSLVS